MTKLTHPGNVRHFKWRSLHAMLRLVFFIASVMFSVKSQAQATCIGVIDGSNNTFCVTTGSITFANAIASGENVQWLSSGDGTFNNPLLQNPTYTPGPKDIAKGSVFIYLDVYKDDPVDYCSVLPLVTLNIGALSAVAAPATQTACSGASISSIILSGSASGTTYRWTRDHAEITGIATSGTGNISGTLNNATGDTSTVTFTITPTNGTCSGSPVLARVLVNPGVSATASVSSQSICSGSTITPVILTSAASGATYSWTRNNTSSVTGIASSGTGDITGSLRNTSTSSKTVTFTITPKANGCNGSNITSTVTVSTSSNVVTATNAQQTTCSAAAISTITPSGGSGTYNWTRNNTSAVTGIAASGTGSISGSLVNNTTSPQYVIFNITASSSSCSNRATVLVNPSPVASVITPSQSICSGAGISPILVNSSMSGTAYTWTRDNAATVTGIASSGTGNNISGNLTNTSGAAVLVTFTITPTANGCSGTPVTATVLVNPSVTGSVILNPSSQTICNGTAINTIIPAGVTGATYNWTRDNVNTVTGIANSGSGNISGLLNNTGSSPVTVTFNVTASINGCVGSPVAATVIVNNAIGSATASPLAQTICSGAGIATIQLSGAGNYTWTRDNADAVTGISTSGSGTTIAGSLINNSTTAQTVNFVITGSNGSCQGTPVTATVTVNPRPVAIISGSQPVCIGGAQPSLNIVLKGTAPWNLTYTDGVNPVSVAGISSSPYTFTVPATAATYSISALSDAVCNGNAADISGTAVLTTVNYTINATAGSNGSISPAGATNVLCGGSQSYLISAGAGYVVADVLVDGISQGAIGTYSFNNITGSHTISASFAAGSQTITATAGANGSISPSGTVSVNNGDSKTFTITSNSCYQIADVLVDGVSQGAISSYTFNNVTTAHSISASFTPLAYTITATAGANGTISPAGATNVLCGGSQSYLISAGAGYVVADVLVDGISQGAIGTYTFNNVTGTHTISASFAAGSQTITATAGANGSISPSGTVSVNNGDSKTFTITSNSCYQIADVLVDGVSQGAISSYTFNNVTTAHSISASFTPLAYTITATAGANGTISPAGATNVLCGGSQSYLISAGAGYVVADVLVDGVSQGAISSYTFSNVTGAHTISASFTGTVVCSAPVVSTTSQNVMCFDAATGLIKVSTSGGTEPFTYAWTGPNGFTASTQDISGLVAGVYNLVVTASGGCTTNNSVTIAQPTSALKVTASAAVIACNGSTTTLTAVGSGGGGTRQYSINGGAFQLSNRFTVDAQGSPYIVTVTDANGCSATSNVVIVSPAATTVPAKPTGISGAGYGLCGGGNFTYTVDAVEGANSYYWSVPSAFTVTGGQGTAQVSFTVPSNYTGSNTGLFVVAQNACGKSESYRLGLYAVLSYPDSALTGPSVVNAGQTGVQYSLPAAAGASYNWLVPSGAVVTSGQGSNAITVDFGTSGGTVSADISNACGTGTRVSKVVSIAQARPAVAATGTSAARTASAANEVLVRSGFTVYPNPANNQVILEFDAVAAGEKLEVTVTNMVGKIQLVKTTTSLAGRNVVHIDLSSLTGGIYLVRLSGKNCILQTQKLFKQ